MELCAERSEEKLRRIGAAAAKRMADFADRRSAESSSAHQSAEGGLILSKSKNSTNRRIFDAAKDLGS